MKCSRVSMSCQELAAGRRPTTRMTKKAGEKWERRMSERDGGKRMLHLDVVCDSGMRKAEKHPPSGKWTREKKGSVPSTGLRTRVL